MTTRIGGVATGAVALLLCGIVPAIAQSPSDRLPGACAEEIRTHAEWLADPDSTWSLSVEVGRDAALRYVGARHSDDPSDPQYETIAAAWEESRPTRAFFEGPDRGIAPMVEETIERYGESGYVRFLAARDSVPVSTLEPSPFDEAAFLRERFSDEEIALFYLLREASRLRERKAMDGPEIAAVISELIARASEVGLLRGEVTSVEALERAYRRYWSEPAEWWRAPEAWFDPLETSERTGGIFTNEVNRASSAFRDRHMARSLVEAVRAGERVFAVVGRNHVPLQAPAIECALGPGDASGSARRSGVSEVP